MPLELNGTLLLVGAGKMGGALLTGWLDRGLDPSRVVIQDPAPPPEVMALISERAIRHEATGVALAASPAVVLIAVKPQVMDAVFGPLARIVGRDTLVLSIAAGRTIASFERHLAGAVAVVRAMPNTPAAIGRGMTVCVGNPHTAPAQRKLATSLLEAVGEVAWVDDEGLMDAVTAVSGSGPAYVFLLTEALTAAGVEAGLAPDLALHLARATVAGSGALMAGSPAIPPATLRRNVTSPGGTTAAALAVLMAEDGLEQLMTRAVAAAKRRGGELAG